MKDNVLNIELSLPQVPRVLQATRFQYGFRMHRLHSNRALKQTNELLKCLNNNPLYYLCSLVFNGKFLCCSYWRQKYNNKCRAQRTLQKQIHTWPHIFHKINAACLQMTLKLRSKKWKNTPTFRLRLSCMGWNQNLLQFAHIKIFATYSRVSTVF